MDLMYYIVSPFSWLLNIFYSLFDNYGIAIILFALVVKVVLFPMTLKGKKSMIQTTMLSGKLDQLKKQYGKDQQRYNLEMQKLYEREKINPMGGCLWSLLPLFILLPLYAIIREPLKHLMGLSAEQIQIVADVVNWNLHAVNNGWIKEAADTFTNLGYEQLYLASLITEETLPAVTAALGEGTKVFAMNFDFFGLDLVLMPTWKIWENPTWPVIGAFLLVLVSTGLSVVMGHVSQKTNDLNSEAKKNNNNKAMMWMMPLMSLWIGFIMPVAMCLYWIANSVFSMLQDVIAKRILKKDYEAARKAKEEQILRAKEEEKRRKEEARLERARRAEEEKQNRKKGIKKNAEPDQPGVNREDSREGLRAHARGRAYIPDRFGGVTPYIDPKFIEFESIDAQGKKKKTEKKPVTGKVDLTQKLKEADNSPASEKNEDDKEGV